MLSAQGGEVRSQPWPLPLPAADADVDVVALREDPAVAAGDGAELDYRAPLVALVEGSIPLEGDALDDLAAEPAALRRLVDDDGA